LVLGVWCSGFDARARAGKHWTNSRDSKPKEHIKANKTSIAGLASKASTTSPTSTNQEGDPGRGILEGGSWKGGPGRGVLGGGSWAGDRGRGILDRRWILDGGSSDVALGAFTFTSSDGALGAFTFTSSDGVLGAFTSTSSDGDFGAFASTSSDRALGAFASTSSDGDLGTCIEEHVISFVIGRRPSKRFQIKQTGLGPVS
jgi:hypothetical protein